MLYLTDRQQLAAPADAMLVEENPVQRKTERMNYEFLALNISQKLSSSLSD